MKRYLFFVFIFLLLFLKRERGKKFGTVFVHMSVLFPGDLITTKSTEKCTSLVDKVSFTEVSKDSYTCRGFGLSNYEVDEEKNSVYTTLIGAGSFYIPRANDMVIGFVKKDLGDYYSIDIGMPVAGLLSNTAYEGATKQTPLILNIGEIVYCRVLPRSVNPEIFGGSSQVQLSCIDQYGSSAKLGKLNGGYVLNTSISNAVSLMNIKHPVLQELSKSITFEFCAGSNGKIWFNSVESNNMVIMWNVFKGITLSEDKVKKVLQKFSKK